MFVYYVNDICKMTPNEKFDYNLKKYLLYMFYFNYIPTDTNNTRKEKQNNNTHYTISKYK